MIKRVQIFFVVLMLLGTSSVMAKGKIVVLSIDQAVMRTEVAKKRLEKLQKDSDYKEDKKDFDELQKKIKGQIEALQKDAAVMSNSKKAAQQKKIAANRADLEHMFKKLQAWEQDVMRELMTEMGPKVQEIVTDLVKTEKIGLLLNSQAAMHADTDYDITAKVTDRLNQGK